jgi:hypothetical protein
MIAQLLSILAALGLLGSAAASGLDKPVSGRNDKVTPAASKSAVALWFQSGGGSGGTTHTDGQPPNPVPPPPPPATPIAWAHFRG